MKACQITKPNQFEVVDIPVPEPLENEVLIKIMACGICGTDIHIFRGEYLGDYPVIPGHEFSGIVEKVGNKVGKFKKGDRIAVEPNIACDNCYNCLHNKQNFCENWQAIGVTRQGGMAQYVTAPEKTVFNIDDIPFEQAAFMEPLSCVLHGIGKLKINLADKIAILGAGPIGILLLQSVINKGAAEITVVDKNKSRIEFAKSHGADIVLNSLDKLKNDYYDAVIDATGNIDVMSKTIDLARPDGEILLFGVPPSGKPMNIEPFKIFKKGLTIISSFTSKRNSFQAISLLKTGKINVKNLITHKLPLEELQKGVELIEKGTENIMKVMIMPNK